jgi:RsiW-degrading membrane proteinase PrsW (M82 family)
MMRSTMACSRCGAALPAEARFCASCGQSASAPSPMSPPPAPGPAAALAGSTHPRLSTFLKDVKSVSLREVILFDAASALEIVRSPVFLFLCLVAVVPLAIQALEGIESVLNGLALWSGLLWALLLYRLFADRSLPVGWAIGTVFFTAFVGLPLLQVYLAIPVNVTDYLIGSEFFPVELIGYVGVGVREELCKAIPLLLIPVVAARLVTPGNGLVLGMMSGIGFAVAENVHYVFWNLQSALSAARQTRQLVYLVGPIYSNVVRMAMTPFFHACLAGIFGYFVAMAWANRERRWAILATGLALAAGLHGLFDALVSRSPLYGVLIEAATFFLVMTYILKARGLGSARQLGTGVFDRTVMISRPP